MNIPTTYAAYLITDAGETKLIDTLWSNDARAAADKAIVGRLDARAVVVTFNFMTLKDDVVYEVKSTAMQHSDLPIPSAALIIEAARDLQQIAIRLQDHAATRRIGTLISAVERGAAFAWDGGVLLVGSPSGNLYRVTQAACDCPNGEKGQYACWHWMSYGLLADLCATLIDSADNDADEAARAQLLLAERLEFTRQFVADASAKLGRRLCHAGRFDYA